MAAKDPWRWWQTVLGSPKRVLAPMVEQSELQYRMLARKVSASFATCAHMCDTDDGETSSGLTPLIHTPSRVPSTALTCATHP